MLTKIFHPNMSKAGEICVDTLKKGWKKEYGVGHVLVVRRRPASALAFTSPPCSLRAGGVQGGAS
jgi:ubiquitin-conjugating enzyme E2 S